MNYKLPTTIGLSSGWGDSFNPDGLYRLTRRRQVNLQAHDAIAFEKPDTMYLKCNLGGTLLGISSGAGSSLYELNGDVFKLKRNGYFAGPPLEESFSFLSAKNNKEFTKTCKYRGIMEQEPAHNEFEMLCSLRNAGFNQAQEPVALLKYQIPLTQDYAWAIRTKITSDVRFDEVIFAALSPYLNKCVQNNTLKLDSKSRTFKANNIVMTIPQTETKILNVLGFTLGSAYRNFHDANFFRGYPHSWFANEVVDSDGTISFVDMEHAKRQKKRSSIFKRKQQIEKTQAQCALFTEWETLNLTALADAGTYLSDGFARGYEKTDASKIPPDLLDSIFDGYERVQKFLWDEQ